MSVNVRNGKGKERSNLYSSGVNTKLLFFNSQDPYFHYLELFLKSESLSMIVSYDGLSISSVLTSAIKNKINILYHIKER